MVTKEQALFYLKRRRRELEAETPAHVDMAQQQLDYAERAKLVHAMEEAKASYALELECYEQVISLVETQWERLVL